MCRGTRTEDSGTGSGPTEKLLLCAVYLNRCEYPSGSNNNGPLDLNEAPIVHFCSLCGVPGLNNTGSAHGVRPVRIRGRNARKPGRLQCNDCKRPSHLKLTATDLRVYFKFTHQTLAGQSHWLFRVTGYSESLVIPSHWLFQVTGLSESPTSPSHWFVRVPGWSKSLRLAISRNWLFQVPG